MWPTTRAMGRSISTWTATKDLTRQVNRDTLMLGGVRNRDIRISRNDGESKCGKLAAPMAYYTRHDTQIYHSLFDNYAICDRYFASVCGPTTPSGRSFSRFGCLRSTAHFNSAAPR